MADFPEEVAALQPRGADEQGIGTRDNCGETRRVERFRVIPVACSDLVPRVSEHAFLLPALTLLLPLSANHNQRAESLVSELCHSDGWLSRSDRATALGG